jgi:hypothetical protein
MKTLSVINLSGFNNFSTSCSIICDPRIIILAAGCSTSSSLMMVAASLVTKSFSKWLITILFIPFGPYAVATVSENSLQASEKQTLN